MPVDRKPAGLHLLVLRAQAKAKVVRKRWSDFAAPYGLLFSVKWWGAQLGIVLWCAACYTFALWVVTQLTEDERLAQADAALLAATGLSIVGIYLFAQSLVFRAAHILFLTQQARADNGGIVDRRLMVSSAKGLWVVPVVCLIVGLVPPLIFPEAVELLLPPSSYSSLVGHLLFLLGFSVATLLMFWADTDYMSGRTPQRRHAWHPIGKPFAARGLTNVLIAALIYGIAVVAGFELVPLPASTGPWQLATWHLVLMGAIVLAGMLLATTTRSVPGHKTIRPSVGVLASPFLFVALNLYIVSDAMLPVAERLAVAWCLSVVPLLYGLPFLRLQTFETPRVKLRNRVRVDLVRAKLVLVGIIERHLPAFAISIPATVFVSAAILRNGLDSDLWSLWLTLTLLWVPPFMYSLIFIEETCEGIYTIQLRRCVQRLREHVLVLGYGDLGRRYVRELLQSGVIGYATPYEHMAFVSNVLLPNGDLAKVFTRIAAIESDPSQMDGVVRPPGRSPMGRASLTRVVRELTHASEAEGNSPTVEYVIPVVNGDATSEEVQNVARIERATFVTCVIRHADAENVDLSQAVVQRLEGLATRGQFVPAALALGSSTYPPYLVERVITRKLPVHYILPAQLEGLNAANLIFALYRRSREAPSDREQIIICGRGKRIFYLIDSFMKAMGRKEFRQFVADQNNSPFLIVMTTGQEFINAGTPFSDSDFPMWKGARDALAALYDLKILEVSRHVSRNPDDGGGRVFDLDPIVTPGSAQSSDALAEHRMRKEPRIPLIRLDSRDHLNFHNVLRLVRPQAVLVSDHDADYEFRAINAIGTTAARLASEGVLVPAPLLMVTGETGKSHLEDNFQRAMVYYQSIREGRALMEITPSPFYPHAKMAARRGGGPLMGDVLIDVLEDPVERLVGLTNAYVQRPRHAVPIEMNFCLSDRPRTLAGTLARLAGCEFDGEAQEHASFTNSRFVADGQDGFAIRSFMELRELPGNVAGDVVPAGPRNPQHAGCARLAVTSGFRAQEAPDAYQAILTKSVIPLALAEHGPGMKALEDYQEGVRRMNAHREYRRPSRSLPREFDNLAAQYRVQATQCCGMPTCPVESFNKIALPVMTNPELKRSDRVDDVIRCFVPNYWNEPHLDTPQGPLAYIRVVCGKTRAPGSFATALNALLRQRLRVSEVSNGEVFDLTYLSSYECHDDRFGVFTCYGRRVDTGVHDLDRRRALDVARLITRVEISPATHRERWHRYAEALAEFLSTVLPASPEAVMGSNASGQKRFHAIPMENRCGWIVQPQPTLSLRALDGNPKVTPMLEWTLTNTTGENLIALESGRDPGTNLDFHPVTLEFEPSGGGAIAPPPLHLRPPDSTFVSATRWFLVPPGESFVGTINVQGEMRRLNREMIPGTYMVRGTYIVERSDELDDVALCPNSPMPKKDARRILLGVRRRWTGETVSDPIEFEYRSGLEQVRSSEAAVQ